MNTQIGKICSDFINYCVNNEIDKLKDMVHDDKWKYCKYYSNVAFVIACKHGNLEIAKLLYSVGNISVHQHDELAFKVACKYGRLNVVKWLYYDVKYVNIYVDEFILFEIACEIGHLELLECLCAMLKKEKRVDIFDYVCNNYGFIFLNCFRYAYVYNNVDIAKWLYSLYKDRLKIHSIQNSRIIKNNFRTTVNILGRTVNNETTKWLITTEEYENKYFNNDSVCKLYEVAETHVTSGDIDTYIEQMTNHDVSEEINEFVKKYDELEYSENNEYTIFKEFVQTESIGRIDMFIYLHDRYKNIFNDNFINIVESLIFNSSSGIILDWLCEKYPNRINSIIELFTDAQIYNIFENIRNDKMIETECHSRYFEFNRIKKFMSAKNNNKIICQKYVNVNDIYRLTRLRKEFGYMSEDILDISYRNNNIAIINYVMDNKFFDNHVNYYEILMNTYIMKSKLSHVCKTNRSIKNKFNLTQFKNMYERHELNINTIISSMIYFCHIGNISAIEFIYKRNIFNFDFDDESSNSFIVKSMIYELFKVACLSGNICMAKWFHTRTNIDIHKQNEYIFRWVCENGFINIAKWLYSLGYININAVDDDAFRSACRKGHLKIARWLYYDVLNESLNIHTLNDNAFSAAINFSQYDVIKWLVNVSDSYIITKIEPFNVIFEKRLLMEYILNMLQNNNINGAFEELGIVKSCDNIADEMCLICHDYGCNNLLKLNCGHYTCIYSLTNWLKHSKNKFERKCTICNRQINFRNTVSYNN